MRVTPTCRAAAAASWGPVAACAAAAMKRNSGTARFIALDYARCNLKPPAPDRLVHAMGRQPKRPLLRRGGEHDKLDGPAGRAESQRRAAGDPARDQVGTVF